MCVPGRYRLPRSLSTRASGISIGVGARDDAFDDLALRVGVVLDVDPVAGGEVALGPQIALPLIVVGAQAVSEGEHPGDLGRPLAEGVEVDVGVGSLEEPVLVPVGLADPYRVAAGLQRRDV